MAKTTCFPTLTDENNTTEFSMEDTEAGLRAQVIRRDDGKFAVSLTDLDSGEVVPAIRIYVNVDNAIGYATKCIAAA